MAASTFYVIYLDRRAREEGTYTRQKRPRRVAAADKNTSASHYNILSSADEVDDNVDQLLQEFEKGKTHIIGQTVTSGV